jgi:FAD/FMN-containing dehydrogenase
MKDASQATPTSKIAPAILAKLEAVVGPAGVLKEPSDVAAYCVSWRDDWHGNVPLVLRPASTEQVADLVKICAEHKVPIVPQGGRTGLTGASQPHNDMSEVIITTERMKQIIALDHANDTMTVEAGVVLKDIQDAADRANRFFPLSLGAEGSCRIGGNISTNAGGVQVLRYGNTRALVLGLEVVLADGRVWNGLRSLRKDNTGYDLKQLFIAGEGTLGIITKAVLRLFPKPTASETAWIAVESPQHGVDLLSHMKAAMGDTITAFELICRQIVDLLLTGVPGHTDPMADLHPWYVLMDVSAQGAPGSLNAQFTGALESAVEKGLVLDAVIAQSSAQSLNLWRMREDMAQAQASAGGSIGHDISVPVSKIPEFQRRADETMEKAYPGVRHCSFGHVGDGNMHYNPIRPLNWEAARFKAERPKINRIVHDIVMDLGGSISAEHGIGQMRQAENVHYKSEVEIDLMRRIKKALDPDDIMNPGKVFRDVK